jgi:hypothetical protein
VESAAVDALEGAVAPHTPPGAVEVDTTSHLEMISIQIQDESVPDTGGANVGQPRFCGCRCRRLKGWSNLDFLV